MFPQGQLTPNYTKHPGSEWIDRNRNVLPDNEWVGADGTGFYLTDNSIDGLMAKIRQRTQNIKKFAIAFITSDSV